MSLPNTAHSISKSTLFPPVLLPEFLNLIKGHSSIARMVGQKPLSFNGNTLFTFNFDNEVDIVAENGAKSAGGAQIGTKSIVPIKIEYGARVSDEFMFAAEEVRLDYLRQFMEGFAAKAARGLDIMAMHGVNPRTGVASDVIGTNNFDSALASRTVEYASSTETADKDVEDAIALVDAADYQVSGLIGGKTIKAALAALLDGDNKPLYPALKWGGNAAQLNGLATDWNGTVEYNSSDARAYVGDWNMFRWGIAKEIPLKVIEYGNPDNDSTAGDLQGHNQVYLRAEMFIGWAILDANAFAAIAVDD